MEPVEARKERAATKRAVEIRDLQTEADALAFRRLNEEWITRFFSLEPKDVETMGDPRGTILARGGRIFLVDDLVDLVVDGGAKTVGCAALIPMGDDVYELSKMAVAPEMRGRGIGRVLLRHLIEAAKTMGARSLFLGSSTKLPNAVHLYKAVGFRHVPHDRLPPMPYTRADVFMELNL